MLTKGKRCIYIKKQVKEFEKEEGKKRIKEKRIHRKGKTYQKAGGTGRWKCGGTDNEAMEKGKKRRLLIKAILPAHEFSWLPAGIKS